MKKFFVIFGAVLIISPSFLVVFSNSTISQNENFEEGDSLIPSIIKKESQENDFSGYALSLKGIEVIEPKKDFLYNDIALSKNKTTKPSLVKGIYLTSYLASKENVIANVVASAHAGKINAVVIDAKNYNGYITYNSNLELVEHYNTESVVIPNIKKIIDILHKNNVYVIARIPIFQDYALALARPDLAVYDNFLASVYAPLEAKDRKFVLWKDNKGLFWMDPASKEVWEYNIAIAKELASLGFDEINFDYIRFPSDGNLNAMEFPVWDYKTRREKVIRDFFSYVRESLGEEVYISADLFGLATISKNDIGIGQIIEYAFENFDFVCPMVYPSHYADNFLGFDNPAEHPYEVVKYSMDNAFQKLRVSGYKSKLRPWLQDFNLGAIYNKDMVQEQIKAVLDSAENNKEYFDGWLLWDPSGYYNI